MLHAYNQKMLHVYNQNTTHIKGYKNDFLVTRWLALFKKKLK